MLKPPTSLISSDQWSGDMRRFAHPKNYVKSEFILVIYRIIRFGIKIHAYFNRIINCRFIGVYVCFRYATREATDKQRAQPAMCVLPGTA